MAVVFDASMVASWLLPDASQARAEAALSRLYDVNGMAPFVLWYEIHNLCLMTVRQNRLPAELITQWLDAFATLPLELDAQGDGAATLALARTHRLSFYDAAYLELAKRRQAGLATLDARLAEAAAQEAITLI